MKKFVSTVALLACAVSSAQAQLFDPKSMGRGGAGVGISHDYRSVTLNPAAASKMGARDTSSVNIGTGLAAYNEDGVVQDAFDIEEKVIEFEEFVATADPSDPNNLEIAQEAAQDIASSLEGIDGKVVGMRSSSGASATIANERVSVSLVAFKNIELAGRMNYVESDAALLQSASFSTDQLQTTVDASYFDETDVGLSFATNFNQLSLDGHDLHLGATVKLKKIAVRSDQSSIGDLDFKGVMDSDNESTDTGLNLDLGVLKEIDRNQSVGLVIRDVISREVKDGSYEIKPKVTAGYSYHGSRGSLAVDADLTKKEAFGVLHDQQLVSVGAELKLMRSLFLRTGYQTNLAVGSSEDFVTVGVGASPFNVLNMDIAAMYGGEDRAGLSASFGLNF